MKAGVSLISITALLCSGCATVNLQSMAGTPSDTNVASYEAESNVVQRAVTKLRAAFASRGFGAKTSQRKMQDAANMLLNGLSAQTVSAETVADAADDYDATLKDIAIIKDDMRMARSHVEQTTRAAEIYLEVAPLDRDMTDELSNLEAALLASERACKIFDAALDNAESPDLIALRGSVDRLRLITDEFGARVRLANTSGASDETSTS